MTRRSKLELWLDVLSVIENGTSKPTHIQYKVELSWKHLQNILKPLTSKGLIREVPLNERMNNRRMKRLYEITQKGEDLLRYFENVNKILKPEEDATIHI